MSLGVLEAVRNLFGGDLANVPVIMSYTNWDSRHRRLQMHDWAKLDDLVDWLRQVRYMGFHVRVNRDHIKQLYAVIIVRAPFSATQRFPEGVLYVDVDNVHVRTLIDQIVLSLDLPIRHIDQIVDLIDQIVLSLDMPDRQIEKGGMAYDSSDAKRAFDVGMQSLMAAMLSEEDAAGAQVGLARKVQAEVGEKAIYLFDQIGYFNNASQVVIADIRVVTRDDDFAILSVAAQGAFLTSNTYCQFTVDPSAVVIDNIGVKLAPVRPTVTLVD
ncbi:hypothetical protein GE061_016770 [Apolygus lucorum]|uniref:Nonstructural protein WIV domain-containing protein n=1 Tax=Apolygus lucorum TaxID=248454 RepID=A0A6A4JLW9_APOLU|nr:hypothetical protein GE061_016770 [Apolygus lucorum]